MLAATKTDRGVAITESPSSIASRVCSYIPPLWDLPNYVAVNPFLGFSNRPILQAAAVVAEGLGAQLLPPFGYYRKRWREGALTDASLVRAAGRLEVDASVLRDILTDASVPPVRMRTAIISSAERVDRETGRDWDGALIRSMTRWCAVYASGGSASWSFQHDRGLFASWKEAESVDQSLEIAGLKGWRRWIRQLPDSRDAAMAQMLDRLTLDASQRESYLYRLLGGVYGWASFFRRFSWQAGDATVGPLADLLAIRVCGDAAVAELAPRKAGRPPASISSEVEDEQLRHVMQEALEDTYLAHLLSYVKPPPVSSSLPTTPDVQAVFCIDVRSEVFRRHLEAQSDLIETKGFAGFFGVALGWGIDSEQSARCPVLLKPAVQLKTATRGASAGWGAIKYLQSAPGASFSFVELLGVTYGASLARDALAASSERPDTEATDPFTLEPDGEGLGIELDARVTLARGILTNMGLRSGFAKLILLCGHQGHSANNPHAAGLDCGACGGHGGSINARVTAAILNDPAVRDALRSEKIVIPGSTFFVAGVHDTSIDQVTLHDAARIPPSHASIAGRLRDWLSNAGKLARIERAANFGFSATPSDRLEKTLSKRARDWSETRPEWGLARNAAFIAARRSRTRRVDMAGRTFLHDYDCAADTDSSVLTLILTAPMIVASWINLQYFGSTVDNAVFGCGDKALHNRVGTLGIVLGNGGDSRTGLPRQSVHAIDGSWFHEPLRLQVVIEAPIHKIDEVLSKHPGVRDLVENGWARMFALSPRSNEVHRRMTGGGWEVFDFSTQTVQEAASS